MNGEQSRSLVVKTGRNRASCYLRLLRQIGFLDLHPLEHTSRGHLFCFVCLFEGSTILPEPKAGLSAHCHRCSGWRGRQGLMYARPLPGVGGGGRGELPPTLRTIMPRLMYSSETSQNVGPTKCGITEIPLLFIPTVFDDFRKLVSHSFICCIFMEGLLCVSRSRLPCLLMHRPPM